MNKKQKVNKSSRYGVKKKTHKHQIVNKQDQREEMGGVKKELIEIDLEHDQGKTSDLLSFPKSRSKSTLQKRPLSTYRTKCQQKLMENGTEEITVTTVCRLLDDCSVKRTKMSEWICDVLVERTHRRVSQDRGDEESRFDSGFFWYGGW